MKNILQKIEQEYKVNNEETTWIIKCTKRNKVREGEQVITYPPIRDWEMVKNISVHREANGWKVEIGIR